MSEEHAWLHSCPGSKCYWCGEEHDTPFWACPRCIPLKEAAYARAREAGLNKREDVLNCVWDELEAKGIQPVPPIA